MVSMEERFINTSRALCEWSTHLCAWGDNTANDFSYWQSSCRWNSFLYYLSLIRCSAIKVTQGLIEWWGCIWNKYFPCDVVCDASESYRLCNHISSACFGRRHLGCSTLIIVTLRNANVTWTWIWHSEWTKEFLVSKYYDHSLDS